MSKTIATLILIAVAMSGFVTGHLIGSIRGLYDGFEMFKKDSVKQGHAE